MIYLWGQLERSSCTHMHRKCGRNDFFSNNFNAEAQGERRAEIFICVTFSAHAKVSEGQKYLFVSQIPMRMLSGVGKGAENATSVPLLTAVEIMHACNYTSCYHHPPPASIDTQIHKYTNIQIHKYTNTQILKYTNI